MDKIVVKILVDEDGNNRGIIKIFINDVEIKGATEFGTDVKRENGIVRQEFFVKLLGEVTIERTTE